MTEDPKAKALRLTITKDLSNQVAAKPEPGTIELKNIGLVEVVSIPITPGVVRLLAPNDRGKSTGLEGVQRLLGDKRAAVTCRRGQPAGSIEGLGVQIGVRKSPRRTGELEAVTLDGPLTIADLVDPGVKDPAVADLRRIRALLTLNGAKPDVTKFYDLLPYGQEQFEDVVGAPEGEDQVALAGLVKRALEAASRRKAELAAKERREAEACIAAFADVDLEAESNEVTLDGAYRSAVEKDSALHAKAEAHGVAAERASEASENLAEAKASYGGPTTEEAEAAIGKAADDLEDCTANVEELSAKLRAAERKLDGARAEHIHQNSVMDATEQHLKLLAGWRVSIDALANFEAVDQAELTTAGEAVTKASEAVQLGARVREAATKVKAAEFDIAGAKAREKVAETYREAARATDDVLSSAVDSEALRVVEGRLMTHVEGRGDVLYHERSQGTRCRLAIDEAVKLIRRENAEGTALIVMPQELWDGLDPTNRREIDAYAKELAVTIITAEAADGELRAEEFTPPTP